MTRLIGSITARSVLAFLYWVQGAASQYGSCMSGLITDIGNGRCDAALNTPSCGYDGGDCCSCTCSDGPEHSCSNNNFDCVYPDCDSSDATSDFYGYASATSDLDGYTSATSDSYGYAPATSDLDGYTSGGYEETTCYQADVANARCDEYNNNKECSWDGGDCCGCSCVSTSSYGCGEVGYSCVDPDCFDPAVVAEFPECTGDWFLVGDGHCDAGNNNAACGYDGGDCCLCTCEGVACEFTGIDCLDPSAGDEFYFFGCRQPTVPPCSAQAQTTWVVENAAQAQAMTEAVNCSGGSFDVEWRGNVTVDRPIYVADGTVLTVNGADTGAVIDGNSSTSLFLVVNATLNVSNADITYGIGSSGGAIRAVGSVLTFNRTSFKYNFAFSNGGVMSVSDGSTVSCVGGTFGENFARNHGGALYLTGSSMVSDDSAWTNNNAGFDGGAVFLTSNSKVSWTAPKFYGNFANGFGGGMFLRNGSTGTVDDGIFDDNTAEIDGGVVGSSALDPITNPTSSTLVINGATTFSDNVAIGNGGALALLGGLSVDIGTVGVSFVNNMAFVAGGAVFVSGTGVGPSFVGVSFVSNRAQVGGAVSTVASGSTKGAGGTTYSTTFDQCRFIDNSAEATGGAIESAAGYDRFANCVFQGNSARGGGALRLAGTTTMFNCSFVDNLSSEGEGAAVSNIGTIASMESLFFANNLFDCPPDMFLNTTPGERYAKVCDGCEETGCTRCSFEEPSSFPMCAGVMEHASSAGGTSTLEDLSIYPGYWRATPSSSVVLACFNADACLGGVTGRASYCLEGYEGPYCAVCSDGYTAELGFACRECSGSAGRVAIAVVLGVAVLFAAIAVASYTTTVSGAVAGGGTGIVERLARYIPLQSVKIVVVAWQILTQFTSVANVTYPDVYERFLDAISVVNLDLGWVLSAGCVFDVDFHDRLLIATIGPIIVLLFLGGTFATAARIHRGKTEILQNIWHKHVSMVLLLTFFVYSSVSSILFMTFACEELEDTKNYLRADYRIECDSSKHKAYQVYAGFMVVLYAVGIPAFCGILLFRERKVLRHDQSDRQETARISSISDLWAPYKLSVFYYEVIEFGRRILLAGVVVFIYPNTAAQIAITLLVSFVFVVVSEGLAPYASGWDAWLSRIGHVVVFVSMYVALLLKVDVSDERAQSQEVFGSLLVAAHACMALVVVVEALLLSFSYGVEQRESIRFGRGKSFRRKVDVASDDHDFFPRDEADIRPRVG